MRGRMIPRLTVLPMMLMSMAAYVTMAHAQVNLPDAPPLPEPRPIAPPVDIAAYPMWMILSAGGIALLLLGLVTWGIVRWVGRRPGPPPPTPRQRAMAALQSLQSRLTTVEPYPFSIEVSDELRIFVTNEFKVSATQRTSPEFLEAVSRRSEFSENDRSLLAAFLEKADLIKFARVHATTADSERLLEQAHLFVKGGRAE